MRISDWISDVFSSDLFQITRLFAVELDEGGAIIHRLLLGLDLAEQVRHADLDAAIAADVQFTTGIDADDAKVLDRRFGAVPRAAADRDLELVRHPAAPAHLLQLDEIGRAHV